MGIATGRPRFGTMTISAPCSTVQGGGQILVADSTAILLGGVDLVDLGLRRLRDVARCGVFQLRAAGLGEPEAAGTDDAGNLRPATTSSIGRESELAEIVAAAADGW